LTQVHVSTAPVLEIDDLRIVFPGPDGASMPIVDGVGFSLAQGQALGVVGESGSGKTMTALAILGLVPYPGVIASGRIALNGRDLQSLGPRDIAAIRGCDVAMVFQDPASAFNPVRSIGSIIVESIMRHRSLDRTQARAQAIAALRSAGIPSPEIRIDAYPHELSGGMRQRAMIALALVNQPSLLIADEPTTALDATVQLQILALLREQAASRALILVTHDLGVAAEVCDRIAVMYHGRIREIGPADAVLNRPCHPYTKALLDLVPRFGEERRMADPIPGAPPRAGEVVKGCAFAARCANALPRCTAEDPPLTGADHLYACWNPVGAAA
jgi:oligopeptide/dipeptide ABC transporter ATP-binding protein